MKQLLFSIIIPLYNSAGKVERCLDSVYSQGVDCSEFEVLCVDDCSPQPSSAAAVTNYKYEGESPRNLRLLRHTVNKRQGGARNTGVRSANGKFIIYIDHDDFWLPGAFCQIKDALSDAPDLDLLMVDFEFYRHGVVEEAHYAHNHSRIVDGLTFLKENELTWAPWGYVYRRSFLIDRNIWFEENVQFEDVDYVIKCVAAAERVQYKLIELVSYSVTDTSQTGIGDESVDKLAQVYMLHSRVRDVYRQLFPIDEAAAAVVSNHYRFGYKVGSYRLIHLKRWRDKNFLVNCYFKGQFGRRDGWYLWLISTFPCLFVTAVHFAAPILRRCVLSHK